MTIIFILRYWKVPIIHSIHKLSVFFIIKICIYYLTNLFFSWLFNTMIIFDYIHYTAPYVLLTNILYIFLTYFILTIMYINRPNFHKFKIISISVFLFFSINALLNNPVYFLRKVSPVLISLQ